MVGYSLGGTVQSVQLGGEADDWLPDRFGDCRIAWHPAGEEKIPIGWHRQREVLTILAGPVAEMVYTRQHHHPALFGPWQHDWVHADQLVRATFEFGLFGWGDSAASDLLLSPLR